MSPRGELQVRKVIPLNVAAAPSSARATCAMLSHANSSPGLTSKRIPSWFANDPVAQKSPASWPKSAATFASRAFTVGSSAYTSSPTSASAIACRIAAEGLVTVSDRRSIAGLMVGTSHILPCLLGSKLHEVHGKEHQSATSQHLDSQMFMSDIDRKDP